MYYTLEQYQEKHPDKPYFIRSKSKANHYLIHHKKRNPNTYSLQEDPTDPVICGKEEGEEFIGRFPGNDLELVLISEIIS